MRWTELVSQRARLIAELSKAGTSIDHLLLDLRDVKDPDMRREVEEAGEDREKLLRLALEWFGDLGNPQPEERSDWLGTDIDDVRIVLYADREPTFRTPDWGRLPPLEDAALDAAESDAEPRLSKLPPLPGGDTLATYTYAELQSAVRSFAAGASVLAVAGPGLSEDDARRIRLLFHHDLLRLEDGKLDTDWRIGRKSSKYALRYWDEGRAKWLDPNRDLVAR